MLCKNCGTELNENAKFCNSCGAAVGTENVPEVSPVPSEDGSENWKGQEPFSGEPAAADEAAQPDESVPSGESAPTEAVAAPAAKKHTLRNVLIAVAVIIVAILIFGNKGKSAGSANNSFSACEHKYVSSVTKEATVSETGIKTYTCSLCGDSYTQTIDKIKSDWSIDYYLDSFGDKTSNAYVIGSFEGSFSNSATTGSDLSVYIYLDKSHPKQTTIRLIEYGWNNIIVYNYDTVTLMVKDTSDSIATYDLFYYEGDLFSFDTSLADSIMNNSSLSFVITISSKYKTIPQTYRFKTNNVGLSELYNKT